MAEQAPKKPDGLAAIYAPRLQAPQPQARPAYVPAAAPQQSAPIKPRRPYVDYWSGAGAKGLKVGVPF